MLGSLIAHLCSGFDSVSSAPDYLLLAAFPSIYFVRVPKGVAGVCHWSCTLPLAVVVFGAMGAKVRTANTARTGQSLGALIDGGGRVEEGVVRPDRARRWQIEADR